MLARLLPVLWVGALLVGCAAVPPVQPTDAPFDGTGDNPVYVVCHGWHTGFVVPAAPLRVRLPGVDQGLGRAPYLELGWGDAVFYRAREFRSGLALRAVFMATDSVVHVAPVPSEVYPFLNTPGVALLCLSDRQLASLLDFIAGSFHRDAGGRIVAASGGAPGRSCFYEGGRLLADEYLQYLDGQRAEERRAGAVAVVQADRGQCDGLPARSSRRQGDRPAAMAGTAGKRPSRGAALPGRDFLRDRWVGTLRRAGGPSVPPPRRWNGATARPAVRSQPGRLWAVAGAPSLPGRTGLEGGVFMCGRFVRHTNVRVLAELVGALDFEEPSGPSYNVAPSQPVLNAVEQDRRRRLRLMDRGLVPRWAKDACKLHPISARAETVATNGVFRTAFRQGRTLIPADGVYE